MKQGNHSFRHESLQDGKSIRELLGALTRGFADGELKFSDEDGEIVLQPEGLLALKVSASEESDMQRVSIRVSWRRDAAEPKKKKRLRVKAAGKGG